MSDIKFSRQKIISKERTVIKTTLEIFNLHLSCYGETVVFSTDASSLQGRTAPNAKRFGIVSYTYRFSIYAELIKQEKSATTNEGAVKLLKTLLEYAPEELATAQQAASRRQEQEREKNRSRGNSNNKFKGK